MATAQFKAAAAARWSAMEKLFAARKKKAAEVAADPGKPDAINVEYFAAELGKRLDPEDTILSEAVTNNPVFARQVPRPVPCTMIRHSGSGLGAAGGLALGVKLARPQHRSVHIVGDGGFYFGNLDSVFAVSKAHGLPIFSIIVDNAGWNAVRDATLRVYPNGTANERDAFQSRLPTGMEFSKLAAVSGAYGECLSDPAQTGAAIDRCLAEVDKGRSALLHVRVTPI
jgi:acetolactate synthase-1/2/3 large subunit